ncbi:hypothetical protein LCGC14_1174880 [marine sediment metagenome]|uniref:Uncharacterized protein n=1 Tax=marine sediment metagenome TaxID=412755 RepID=A0A0F9MBQ0_9ZZZZ
MEMSSEPRPGEDYSVVAWAAGMSGDIESTIVASTPGGIERQEAEGQKTFAASEELPCMAPWDILKEWGIVELEDHNEAFLAGKLFCKVKLPEGWKKQPTDHSMWTDLLDETGKKRAGIFYKAAFYDQDAFLNVTPQEQQGGN